MPAAALHRREELMTAPSRMDRRDRSSLRRHPVVLAEMIARQHVEIGAGDADHPGLFRMRGRMDHARAIGLGLPRAETIHALRFEDDMLLAFGIGAAPLRHLGIFPRVTV